MTVRKPRRSKVGFHCLFFKELKEVLRDRRAAFFTFLFPLLLYPILFFVSSKVEQLNANAEVEGAARIGLSGSFDDFYKIVAKAGVDQISLNVPPVEEYVERGEFDVLLSFVRNPMEPDVFSVRLLYDGAAPLSKAAYRRVQEFLERYRLQLVANRLRGRGVELSSSEVLAVERRDVAGGVDISGALLARFLPSVLVLLFFSGGAFAALDLVAGEKERGTLETLFVQPVSPRQIIASKFFVVIVCSVAAAVINGAGMILAQTVLPVSSALLGVFAVPSAIQLGLICVAVLPLVILSSGILMAVSTVARTFREAQTYLLPVMLIALIPASLTVFPTVELNLLTAWIPIGNVSLVVRDVYLGKFSWIHFSLASATSLVYAIWTVQWAANLLCREDVILGSASESNTREARMRDRFRRAIFFGVGTLLFVYYTGTLAQSPHGRLGPFWGLAVTLWILVLAPAFLFVRCYHIPLSEAFAFRAPRFQDVVAVLTAVPPVAVLVTAYMLMQNRILPFPQGIEDGFRDLFALGSLHPVVVLLLFAISPAICEEVLWRGTFQGELERGTRPLKTILLVGLFFGLFHFSVYRFVPTAIVGCVLAFIRWRTHSIVPCVIFHAAYNSLILFGLGPLAESGDPTFETLSHPFVLAVAGGIVALAACTLSKRTKRANNPGFVASHTP